MNIGDWLVKAQVKLAQTPTPHLDAMVLLTDILKTEKSWILSHPEMKLSKAQVDSLNNKLVRRAKNEPLAYIRKKSEFYGREFNISPDTLVPRPETEAMIDLFRSQKVKPATIIDVGTGSGAIAITIKLLFPEINVFATDISEKCLKIAQLNAKKHQIDISFFKGNLLEPIHPEDISDAHNLLVFANLPYVPNSHTINEAAMQEPKVAIFGGEDGLDLYRELFDQVATLIPRPQYVLTESLPFQHQTLSDIANQFSYTLQTSEDFIQVFESN